MSYLRTGVKGCSKIRCILAKVASYFRQDVPFIQKVLVLSKAHLMFLRINGPNVVCFSL